MFCAGFDSMVPISLLSLVSFPKKRSRHTPSTTDPDLGLRHSLVRGQDCQQYDHRLQISTRTATGCGQSSPFSVRRTSARNDSLHLQYRRYTMTDVTISNSQPVPMLDFSRQFAALRQELLAAMEAVCLSQQFIL